MARSRGRGNAFAYTVAIGWFLCVLLQFEYGDAATFIVGDSKGWNFNVNSWPDGKVFRDGDVLKFNYDPANHNVVVVDEVGYNSCKTPTRATVLRSGSDKITISSGPNFFLCNFPGHCDAGMKIAIHAN